jgi:ribosome-binding factor A
MLPYKRSRRVGHQLRREISDIIATRVKDPRLGFLTVVDVATTDDLKLARVYISVLREAERDITMDVLENAKGRIRAELGKRLRMRFTPALEFHLDTTAQYGDRIERLLRELDKSE